MTFVAAPRQSAAIFLRSQRVHQRARAMMRLRRAAPRQNPLGFIKGSDVTQGRRSFLASTLGGDRGRDGALTPPLPPNRTGGFPASGFPVGGLFRRSARQHSDGG